MIKSRYILACCTGISSLLCQFIIAGFLSPASAQYIRFHLEVETEASARNENSLNFGSLQYGLVELNLGDSGAGVFSISGYEDAYISIKINAPEYLIHSRSAVGDRIRLNLKAAYANRGRDDPAKAVHLPGNSGRFAVRDRSGEPRPRSHHMQQFWLYIYGDMDIGRVADGLYRGTVTVRVEYE